MKNGRKPIEYAWYLPSNQRGDATRLGTGEVEIPPEIDYLVHVAQTAEASGLTNMLIPCNTSCSDGWLLASAIARETQQHQILRRHPARPHHADLRRAAGEHARFHLGRQAHGERRARRLLGGREALRGLGGSRRTLRAGGRVSGHRARLLGGRGGQSQLRGGALPGGGRLRLPRPRAAGRPAALFRGKLARGQESHRQARRRFPQMGRTPLADRRGVRGGEKDGARGTWPRVKTRRALPHPRARGRRAGQGRRPRPSSRARRPTGRVPPSPARWPGRWSPSPSSA